MENSENKINLTNLDFLGNEYYKILKAIYDTQIQIGNELVSRINQDEICLITNLSKAYVNRKIKVLKDSGLIIHHGRGLNKYSLSDKANKIMKYLSVDTESLV